QLELQPLDFEEEYPAGAIDFGPDITQRGGLEAAGRAELNEEHHGKHQKIRDIRLKGEGATAHELACERCLDTELQPAARNCDTPRRVPEAGALMIHSKAAHSPNARIVTSVRCHIAPVLNAAITKAVKL